MKVSVIKQEVHRGVCGGTFRRRSLCSRNGLRPGTSPRWQSPGGSWGLKDEVELACWKWCAMEEGKPSGAAPQVVSEGGFRHLPAGWWGWIRGDRRHMEEYGLEQVGSKEQGEAPQRFMHLSFITSPSSFSSSVCSSSAVSHMTWPWAWPGGLGTALLVCGDWGHWTVVCRSQWPRGGPDLGVCFLALRQRWPVILGQCVCFFSSLSFTLHLYSWIIRVKWEMYTRC